MTVNGADVAASARREYMRQWRANNRDKVKANNERYWAKKGAELLKAAQQERRAET